MMRVLVAALLVAPLRVFAASPTYPLLTETTAGSVAAGRCAGTGPICHVDGDCGVGQTCVLSSACSTGILEPLFQLRPERVCSGNQALCFGDPSSNCQSPPQVCCPAGQTCT